MRFHESVAESMTGEFVQVRKCAGATATHCLHLIAQERLPRSIRRNNHITPSEKGKATKAAAESEAEAVRLQTGVHRAIRLGSIPHRRPTSSGRSTAPMWVGTPVLSQKGGSKAPQYRSGAIRRRNAELVESSSTIESTHPGSARAFHRRMPTEQRTRSLSRTLYNAHSLFVLPLLFVPLVILIPLLLIIAHVRADACARRVHQGQQLIGILGRVGMRGA